MSSSAASGAKSRPVLTCLLVCAAGIALNLALNKLAALAGLPLYVDSVGTILTAVIGGYLPGVLVGYLTNLLRGLSDEMAPFYGVISVLIAVLASFLARRKWFRSYGSAIRSVPLFAMIGGGLGSVLTFALYGLKFGEELSATLAHFFYDHGLNSVFWAQFAGDFLIDLADKLLTVLIVCLILRLIPEEKQKSLRLRFWQQNPMSAEERAASRRFAVRKMSLRPKFLLLIMVAMLIVAVITTGIGFTLYRGALIETRTEMGRDVTRVVMSSFDPDRVEEYMTLGEEAPGYTEIEQTLARLRDSSEDISYIYVYQIREDGCHVVFDPDTADEPGLDPGAVIGFGDAFEPYRNDLLAGKEIEPVESNETYGWLFSIFTPVKDSSGRVVCYACADISMEKLASDQYSFLAKVLSLFVSFIAILLAAFLLMADSGVILPINAMALASSRFAFDSVEQRNDSLDQLRSLGIHTGDEIENLYSAIAKTTEDSVRYIAESQQKNETIASMQENLITVLADMVESRDQFTGNHIKNTADYVRIIMEKMRENGVYTDRLTDEFIQNVIHSAPLHDIGKIRVSDTILNKPGKLSDDEFEKMKLHTVYGREVIQKAKIASPGNSYLSEAENLATFHHEKWNGKGYPYGLAGEDIPLSARIMAVADVFDALVSKRSYKDPFPFEKAMDIIREGSGNHFDPAVAEAFLSSEEKVKEILAEHPD